MEVIQDLHTLQLESIESTDPALAMLYGGLQQLPMLSSGETVEDSTWGPGLVDINFAA